MIRRQIPTALFLSAVLAVASTATVLAKDDAIVTLDATLPSDPEPGSEITIGWTVETPGMGGELEPFNADAVFVRLIPVTGDPVEAVGRQGPPGHYVATVTVPSGGIADVEVGVRGESCSAGTCQRSDILFTIDETAAQAAAEPGANGSEAGAPAVPPVDATSPVGAPGGLQPVGILGLALAGGAVVLALALIRARGRALTPGSSRS